MAPGTLTSADDKIQSHESAAHEKRNWVRLSYDCNNHCVFCLDSNAHDGTMRANLDIKVQIIEGRKKGATRLILSGGEPTMHPNFLDFVKLGARAGYPKIQTVTNGRMFAYPDFLQRAADNGLHEITFSLHGHTPKLHDRLVGTPGAFEEEVRGLRAALDSGRFIVNVDIVINKQNVKHLPQMLETFISWGVQEFDLLHVIPFGNAWTDARDHLFYDLEGNEESLRKAMEYSRRPDIHIWLNRFPPPYTEGFEELIQDPYKMTDEVRGRREEFDRYLALGEKLRCREPERCKHCYLQDLCDGLDAAIDDRSQTEVHVLRMAHPAPESGSLPRAEIAHVVAKDLADAAPLIDRAGANALWLELESFAGVEQRNDVVRCITRDGQELSRLLETPRPFAIVAQVCASTEPVLAALSPVPQGLILAQPDYARVTENLEHDVDLRALCQKMPAHVRTVNIPACIGGREPEPPVSTLDASMLGPDARLDMGHYTERYIAAGYRTKSRRCHGCRYDSQCRGVHINYVRAHGYRTLEPV
ncbi:MAG: radical SAM protein [Myxococcales bacterium]|nr:radical SAM protein [Myxococcales bacterium]MCB9580203.1 radical SAM protein [Polyangiaceae bacterium]